MLILVRDHVVGFTIKKNDRPSADFRCDQLSGSMVQL